MTASPGPAILPTSLKEGEIWDHTIISHNVDYATFVWSGA
jgi:hypothetical protein